MDRILDLRRPKRISVIAMISAGSAAAPNHGHRSRQAAAHVEREESFHVFDLSRAGLFCELLIRFENLANTSRTYRMAVPNQAATCVHWNLEWRYGFFGTHQRQRCRAAFYKLHAFARLGEPENFVGDNFSDGKAIMHLGPLQIAWSQVCHAESFLRCFPRDRKRWR